MKKLTPYGRRQLTRVALGSTMLLVGILAIAIVGGIVAPLAGRWHLVVAIAIGIVGGWPIGKLSYRIIHS